MPLDTDNVNAYVDVISALNLKDYKTCNATEEDISGTFTLHISRDPKEKKKAEEKALGKEEISLKFSMVNENYLEISIVLYRVDSLWNMETLVLLFAVLILTFIFSRK